MQRLTIVGGVLGLEVGNAVGVRVGAFEGWKTQTVTLVSTAAYFSSATVACDEHEKFHQRSQRWIDETHVTLELKSLSGSLLSPRDSGTRLKWLGQGPEGLLYPSFKGPAALLTWDGELVGVVVGAREGPRVGRAVGVRVGGCVGAWACRAQSLRQAKTVTSGPFSCSGRCTRARRWKIRTDHGGRGGRGTRRGYGW